MAKFTDLPFEIVRLIALNLRSLKCFSLVNVRCRAASAPDLFHTLKVPFSEKGLKIFEELASSSLSPYVRVLHYEASELVDPCTSFKRDTFVRGLIFIVIQHWDYFSACIYTPQEYVRDQKDFQWDLRGKEFSYAAMFRYFRKLAKEQSLLLKKRRDIHVFSRSLRYFVNLRVIKLTFNGAKEDQLLWFAHRLFLDGDRSFSTHIETVFRGMTAAYAYGLSIEKLEIDGTRPRSLIGDDTIFETARTALMPVKSIKLVNGLGLLPVMSSIPLPSLQQFEMANCWLVGRHLMKFLEVHRGVIRGAHFDGINLHSESDNDGCACLRCPKTLLEALVEAGNIGILVETLVIAKDSRT